MSDFLTIDYGNSIVKTNKNVSFNSQIVKTDKDNISFSDAIIINDDCYAIGQGEYENKRVKADKTYIEQFILYAIGCSTDENEVDVIFNLPINQLTSKQDIISKFSNKQFVFTINSQKYRKHLVQKSISICKVGVVAECVAAYYSLSNTVTPFILMLDIGSKTINFAAYTDIGEMDLKKSGTLDFGIHDFYQDIVNYYRKQKRISYSVSDIDKRIRNNKIVIPEELEISFIQRIKNGFEGLGFNDYNDYSIRCSGGGSIVLENSLLAEFDDIKVLENPLFSNVRGSEIIGEAIGFSKSPVKPL